MDSSNVSGTVGRRRRFTVAELSEILDSVAAKRKDERALSPVAPFVEKKICQEIYQAKPEKYFTKAAAFGAPEKNPGAGGFKPRTGDTTAEKNHLQNKEYL